MEQLPKQSPSTEEQSQSPYMEAPLEGLISKPMHLMSTEELRAKAQRIQNLRQSSQALMAVFRGGGKKEEKVDDSSMDEFV